MAYIVSNHRLGPAQVNQLVMFQSYVPVNQMHIHTCMCLVNMIVRVVCVCVCVCVCVQGVPSAEDVKWKVYKCHLKLSQEQEALEMVCVPLHA